MSNIFSVPGFRAHVLARVSEGTLPESVVDKLKLNLNDDGENEATQLLKIIREFEKNPLDVRSKNSKYEKLMQLFYRGVGLNKDGKGTISNERDALELVGLINDAILQDQQNIGGRHKYNGQQLKEALDLQDKFRKELEASPAFKKLLMTKNTDTEIQAYQREYQTEKITSYLAKNNKVFQDIFKKLRKSPPQVLKGDENKKLESLRDLAGTGEKRHEALNTILSTFKEFHTYAFKSQDMRSMKSGNGFVPQAETESSYSNWVTVKGSSGSGDSDDDEGSSSSSRGGPRGDPETTNRILRRILARLEKLDPDNDGVINNSSGARGSGNNRSSNRSNNRCNCGNCNSCNNADNSSSNGNNDIPSWARNIGLGLNLAGQFLNITGLGNNNQNCGCYSPAPCYGGGSPSPCPPMPYYVGGNTWPWGGANGINGQYGASNNAIPSSVSSNPYSTASAYNNTPVNVNVRVNPRAVSF